MRLLELNSVYVYVFAICLLLLATPTHCQPVELSEQKIDPADFNGHIFNCLHFAVKLAYEVGNDYEANGFSTLGDMTNNIYGLMEIAELKRCKVLRYINYNKKECIDEATMRLSHLLETVQKLGFSFGFALKGLRTVKNLYSALYQVMDKCIDKKRFEDDNGFSEEQVEGYYDQRWQQLQLQQEEQEKMIKKLQSEEKQGFFSKILSGGIFFGNSNNSNNNN